LHLIELFFLKTLKYRDFITNLPEDLAIRILSYLTAKELLNIGRVCKSWKYLSKNEKLWESNCREVVLENPLLLSLNIEWRLLYKKNEKLKRNWKSGKCRILLCKGHTNRYVFFSIIFYYKHLLIIN
jgi:hypothetical protein